jgi:hypothetical protein
LVAIALLLVASSAQAAPIIFDDFNTNEGHFNQNPNFSGTSNISSASTANRVTTGSFEGAGNEEVVAVLSTTNPARIRFVSGNGTMANNVAFTTGPGTDGFIGFYYKTTTAGLKLQLNLDGDTVGDTGVPGTTSELDGSPVVTTIGDGGWHLAEFNLDATSGWGASTGLGGGHGGVILDGTHTIDSIMISSITVSNTTIAFDFVAKSDSGSIAALVPEPVSLGAVGLAGLALMRRRRR